MLNFILLFFCFAALVGGVLAFFFFKNKKIELHTIKIENKKEYLELLNSYIKSHGIKNS